MNERQVALVVLLTAVVAVPTAAAGNEPPLADAGLDQWVERDSSVRLDAAGSRDPDGEITRYRWTIERPSGGTVSPACASCARTRFRATEIGRYEVTVRVTDDEGATRSDTLYVYVERAPGTGTATPTATPTSTPTPTPNTPSPAPTPGSTPTGAPTVTTTPSSTVPRTPMSTSTSTQSPTPVPTPTPTSIGTPTPAPNAPPVARINTKSTPGAGGGTATFEDGGSYDPDGNITRREWSVDGGNAGIGSTLSTRLGRGRHTVTLRVVDEDGLDDTATTTVEVDPAGTTNGCINDCADLNVIGIDMTGENAYVAAPGETITVEPSVAWEGTTSEEYNTVRAKFEGHGSHDYSGASGSLDAPFQQTAGTTRSYTARVGWVSSLTTAWRADSYASKVEVLRDNPTKITDGLSGENANIGPNEGSTTVTVSVNAEDKDPGLVEYGWSVSGGAEIYGQGRGSAEVIINSEGSYEVSVTTKGRTPDGSRGGLASSKIQSATISVDKIEATREDSTDGDDGGNSDIDLGNIDNDTQQAGQASDEDEGSGTGSGLVAG